MNNIFKVFKNLYFLVILFNIISCGDDGLNNNDNVKISRVEYSNDLRIKRFLNGKSIDCKIIDSLLFDVARADQKLITSKQKFNFFDANGDKWIFPYKPWVNTPTIAVPIMSLNEGNFKLYIIGFGLGSTGTINFEAYAFLFSSKGRYLDNIKMPNFILGDGDAEAMKKSRFYKRNGCLGSSKIEVSSKRIVMKSLSFKLYLKGTEQLNLDEFSADITQDGSFKLLKGQNSQFFYFKDGIENFKLDSLLNL